MTSNIYKTEWTGKYPCFCAGRWHLYENDHEINLYEIGCSFVQSLESYSDEHANTYGVYSHWYFDDDWLEYFEDYTEGLEASEWIDKNKDWLINISDNEEDWYLIYDAFQTNDWRYGECGGCI